MALGLPHIDFGYTTHSPVIKHSKGRWDWSENSAGTPNQRAFKLSVGGPQQLNSSQKYIYIYIYICVFRWKLTHFWVILVASLGGQPHT